MKKFIQKASESKSAKFAGIAILLAVVSIAYHVKNPKLVVENASQQQLICAVFPDGEAAAFAHIALFKGDEFIWTMPRDAAWKPGDDGTFPGERKPSPLYFEETQPAILNGRVPAYDVIPESEGAALIQRYYGAVRWLIQMGESGCANVTGLEGKYRAYFPNYVESFWLVGDQRWDLKIRDMKKSADRVTLALPRKTRSLRLEFGVEPANVIIESWYIQAADDDDCIKVTAYNFYIHNIQKQGSEKKSVRLPVPFPVPDGWKSGKYPYTMKAMENPTLTVNETIHKKYVEVHVEQRHPDDPFVVSFP